MLMVPDDAVLEIGLRIEHSIHTYGSTTEQLGHQQPSSSRWWWMEYQIVAHGQSGHRGQMSPLQNGSLLKWPPKWYNPVNSSFLPTCALSLIWVLFLVPSLSLSGGGGHLACSGHSFMCNAYVCHALVGTFVKFMMHKKFRYWIWLHFGYHFLLFILIPKVFSRFHRVK